MFIAASNREMLDSFRVENAENARTGISRDGQFDSKLVSQLKISISDFSERKPGCVEHATSTYGRVSMGGR